MSRAFHRLVPRAASHGAYSGPPRIYCEDHNAAALHRLARYRLYAACERAPANWEHRA